MVCQSLRFCNIQVNALSPFHDHFILGFSLGVKLPKHGCNQVDEAPADCDNIIDFAVPAKLDAFCSAVACKYKQDWCELLLRSHSLFKCPCYQQSFNIELSKPVENNLMRLLENISFCRRLPAIV